MAWNTWLTVRGQPRVNPVVPLESPDAHAVPQTAVPASA
jgi:cytochrome c oxidase cbb3-type subunit 1